MFKDSYNLILKHKSGKLFFLSALLALTVGMNAVTSTLLMEIIDTVLPTANIKRLVMSIIIYVAISLMQSIAAYFCSTYNSVFSLQVIVEFKKKIIERIYKRPGTYFSKNAMGDLYQNVESDITIFCEFVISNIFSILNMIINLIVSFGFLLILDWKLLLIILVILPISFVFQAMMSSHISKLSENQRQLSGEYTTLSQTVISNPIDLILSGHRKKIVGKMFKKMDQLNQASQKFIAIEMFSIHMGEFIAALTMCVVIGYSGYSIIEGTMSVGELVVFMTYSQKLVSVVSRLIEFSVDFSEVKPIYDRIMKHMNYVPEDKRSKISEENILSVVADNLCFSYENGTQIYNNLTYNFENGKSYGIVGKTGEGKSTIVKLLYGLWFPQSGNLYIGGNICSKLQYDAVSEIVTYVSPNPFMMNDTIYHNVTMYDDTFTEEAVWEVLQKTQLFDEVKSMKNGIATLIGDNGVTLSSGQKQRLALARAMLLGKKIIILDEPTSTLDKTTASMVTKAIYEVFKDKMIIIISHDRSVVDKCDVLLKLENGELTEISKKGK